MHILVFAAAALALSMWFFARAARLPRNPASAATRPPEPVASDAQPAATQAPPSPAILPNNPPPFVPAKDAWETGFLVGSDDELPVQVRAQIEYTDGTGQGSKRNIRTVAIYPDQGALLAFCELRQENRTFLFARLRSFADLDTGEVVEDPLGYLERAYEQSPAGIADNLVFDHGAEVDVLLFLTRQEPRLSQRRKAALVAHLLQYAPEWRTGPEHMWAKLKDRLVSRGQMQARLKELRGQPAEERAVVLAGARAIVAATEKRDPMLDAAYGMIERALV